MLLRARTPGAAEMPRRPKADEIGGAACSGDGTLASTKLGEERGEERCEDRCDGPIEEPRTARAAAAAAPPTPIPEANTCAI